MEGTSGERPNQAFNVGPTDPLPPLHHLIKYLIELFMNQAQEAGRKGNLLTRLRTQAQPDAHYLLHLVKHFESCRVPAIFSKEDSAESRPSFHLGRRFVPSRDKGELLSTRQKTGVRGGGQTPPSKDGVPTSFQKGRF